MTLGRQAACVMVLVSCVTAARADGPDLTQWRYVAPVLIPQPPTGGLVELALGPEVFDRAKCDLADLRLLAADGGIVPYVIRIDRGKEAETVSYKPARLFNAVFTPGLSSTVTVDFGAPAGRTGVRIDTPGSDFRRRVKVEAGADGRSWRVLRASAWLFRVGRWGREFDKSWVSLPDNDFRYLRITVFNAPDDPKRLRIQAVSARYVSKTPPATAAVEVRSTHVTRKPKIKATEIEADLGWENLPLAGLTLSFGDANFLRRVEVLGRNRKTEMIDEAVEDAPPIAREVDVPWTRIAGGTIHRFPAAGDEAPSVGLDLPVSGQYRYLLVRVFNEDDQPLTFQGLTVRRLQYYVDFQPAQAGPYELYLGRPDAAKPRYDLGHFVDRLRAEGVAKATLGKVVPNPRYVRRIKPVPWSQRLRWLLWVVLIAVGGLLAVLVIRQARQAKGGSEGEG